MYRFALVRNRCNFISYLDAERGKRRQQQQQQQQQKLLKKGTTEQKSDPFLR